MSEDEAAASRFSALTVTTKTSSSVVLSWSYDRPGTVGQKEIVFKLLKLESRDEWRSIAWTRKYTCTIENLEQNVCYSLQMLVLVEESDEFEVLDESEIFKVK
jgi:Fibronectin type III domain